MSRKTEPRVRETKKGDCSNCGGVAYVGMYHEKCNYCGVDGNLTKQP